jgi:BlaI family penicillinase repressor
MARNTLKRLSPLEALIMDCIWDETETTVRQVQERLQDEKPMAYNTVLTMMRILRDKGFLSSKREGRMDVYRPRITREQMAERSLGEVLDRFFAGSATSLVSQLLDSGDLGTEEIKAIRQQVNRRLRKQSGANGDQQ